MRKILLAIFTIASTLHLIHSQSWILENVDPDTGNRPQEIASGDIDGDGDIDLVMATYDFNGGTPNQDYIKCYLNDGSGNFSIQITVSSSIFWVDGLILADVNGDGAADIVATSVNQNKLVYYLSSTSMGAGYSYSEVAVDNAILGPGQVVAGDINGDDHVDLAVPSYTNNRTQWYSGDGAGNFTAETDIESGTTNGPYYMDIGDYDGDGDLDAIVGFFNNQSIEIFYNQYDANAPNPSSTVSWIKDTESVGTSNADIRVIAMADVNNDGGMDIVKLENSNGVVEWYDKTINGVSIANTISNNSIIRRPGTFHITDMDEDGLNDVILTGTAPASGQTSADNAIIWFKGAANSAPSATPSLIDDGFRIIFDITTADFDGDNDIDIASVDNVRDNMDWIENNLNSLNIDELQLNKLYIHPNPVSDVLNIEGFTEASIDIAIFDLLGKSVLKKDIEFGEKLDVSQLESGIYTVSVNGTFASKFIKE